MFHVKHHNHIEAYIKLLKKYNETTNIYSKKSYDKLPFHIEDSVNIANMITDDKLTVVDIGSGSGFPSVITAICNKNNKVYAVESKSRKCEFLRLCKHELALENYEIINMDVNEFLNKQKKGFADFFTAKAFGPMQKTEKIFVQTKKPGAKLIIPISKQQEIDAPTFLRHQFKIHKINDFLYLILQ
jgi:16S rRNA (guanine(527)-N(7))-methyltransferase RsmG